ncbi:MAG TPA: carboxypeptidase-like regulatory domain-containing protein [Novosphingobium sp.]|nr:carboxypeptidase-like regulatory domain-containing protein [Novosphingobium sp.]HQA16776.1 carboxypeptidase-like regulatory domain-containing protein [Novosphingobium sp.]
MRQWLARTRKIAALAGAVLAVWAQPAQADAWRANEDDSLLLELHSGKYRLGEPLRGYQTPTGVCVDFADLIQALDLPIRLDKKSRRATGWIFAEDQRLVIDRDSNTVQTVNGNRAIAGNAIHDTPEGWCMGLNALSDWMGVKFRPDLGNMVVVIETDRKLPFLEAIERKSRAARLRKPPASEFNLASLPQADAPYKAWRAPSVDIQVQAQWSSARGLSSNYEVLAGGEALGMSYSARLAGADGPVPDSARIRIYRNDPSGEMLGSLGATQVAFGDVDTPPSALAAQSAYGRGVFVSNRPLNLPSRFGTTTLRGTLPAGWDAELYRNGVLRAYQADRGDGRYEFADVDLLFGENEFDVVLYGPQGQVRHERTSQNVGIESIPAGKTFYWAGMLDEGRDLIDLGAPSYLTRTGWRWGTGVERGLDSRTTAGLGYHSLTRSGHRRHYLEAILRRSVGPMLLELSGAQQFGAGRALRAEAMGRIKGVNFNAQVLWVDGEFDSDLVSIEQRREFGLRLSGPVKLGGWSLPVEAGVRQTLSRRGVLVTEWLTRGSAHIGRASLTLELMHRAVSGPAALTAGEDRGNRLTLIGNVLIGRLRLRGQSAFGLDGNHPGFQRAQIVADAPLGPVSTLRAGYDYDAVGDRQEWSLGYVHQFRRFALRGEGRIDNRGNLGFGLTLAFSLGPDPVDGGWRASRERLASTGQASVEVYRDENGDGQRQADEPAVEGVAVEAGFRSSDKATNGAGRAVIDGLVPYVPVLVSIDAGSLSDPLLQPKGRGMVVVPRPGVAAKVSLPLAPTGEIEAVLLGADGEPRGGAGVELIDEAGQVVLRGQSDFDGYLFFDSVPYGSYRLRLTEPSARALGVRPELSGALRIDRATPSLRLGQLRLVLLPQAPSEIASAH